MQRQLFRLFGGGRLCLLPLFCLIISDLAWGQEREHFQLKIGAAYDRGDFGSPDITKVFYTPITLRYLGNRFDVSVTPSFAKVNTVGGIRLIEGIPTPTGEQAGAILDTRSGAGDTIVRGRVQLLNNSSINVTPFGKVKIPTAPESVDLGTGKADYGVGVELDKEFSPVLLFGDLSYTVIGKLPGLGLRNRVGASVGLGGRLSESVVLSGLVDWRRSILVGNEDPAELVGVIGYRVSRTVTVSPNVYVGLSNSSPNFGMGVELAFRFGSY